MYILTIAKKNKVFVHRFKTVSEAYKCYLDNYATLGDYWYYFRCCGVLLNRVKEERIMECVFRNVTKNAVLVEARE